MTDEFWAASWVSGIIDDLEVLNRKYTGVNGFEPIDMHEYRMGLHKAAESLIHLNARLLTGFTQGAKING